MMTAGDGAGAGMRMEFSGFNGFGQFGDSRSLKAQAFEDFSTIMLASTTTPLLIACAWSYNALAADNRILLQGLLSQEPNSTLCVTAVDSIQAIRASDNFCLALLANGSVYKLPPALGAKLQEVRFDVDVPATPSMPQKRSIFGKCKSVVDEPLRITHIAIGTSIAVAVSSDNAVFSIPSQIHKFPRHFRTKQLLCGMEHAMLLSGNGDIYSWGNGLRGQLGHDVLRMEEKPTLLEALAGIKITYIAAGGWSGAAISAFGDLYTWGGNGCGELGLRVIRVDGLRGPTVYPLPQLVDLPEWCKAKPATPASNENDIAQDAIAACDALRIFAGSRHMLLQMSCGTLFATGWNMHGQLGVKSDRPDFDEFTRIERDTPADSIDNMDVICGHWNTIIRKHCRAS